MDVVGNSDYAASDSRQTGGDIGGAFTSTSPPLENKTDKYKSSPAPVPNVPKAKYKISNPLDISNEIRQTEKFMYYVFRQIRTITEQIVNFIYKILTSGFRYSAIVFFIFGVAFVGVVVFSKAKLSSTMLLWYFFLLYVIFVAIAVVIYLLFYLFSIMKKIWDYIFKILDIQPRWSFKTVWTYFKFTFLLICYFIFLIIVFAVLVMVVLGISKGLDYTATVFTKINDMYDTTAKKISNIDMDCGTT